MNIVPLAFAVNRLTGIDRGERRLDSESGLFSEVRDLLKKHGVEKKYGLALLHKHFDLADDEVLVEYTDVESRTLTTKPARRCETSDGDAVETVWSLDSGSAALVCIVFCYRNSITGQHGPHHDNR
jgi:hypothetical protein